MHGVLVVRDEIHADITFASHSYTPFASLSQADALNSLTCLWLTSMPCSCGKASTFQNWIGSRTYIITAGRMISGLVLKCLVGARLAMR